MARPGTAAHEAGDITLSATGRLDDITSGFLTIPLNPAIISTTSAKVLVEGSTLHGRDVNIIADADSFDTERIRHFDPSAGGVRTDTDWLTADVRRIGLLAGASCPPALIDAVIDRLRTIGEPAADGSPGL